MFAFLFCVKRGVDKQPARVKVMSAAYHGSFVCFHYNQYSFSSLDKSCTALQLTLDMFSLVFECVCVCMLQC